jgi:hypothetical protein
MTHHIRHGNTTTVYKMGPTIVVGSAKAQGSKTKPIDGMRMSGPLDGFRLGFLCGLPGKEA